MSPFLFLLPDTNVEKRDKRPVERGFTVASLPVMASTHTQTTRDILRFLTQQNMMKFVIIDHAPR